jgi:hypothetical protein
MICFNPALEIISFSLDMRIAMGRLSGIKKWIVSYSEVSGIAN